MYHNNLLFSSAVILISQSAYSLELNFQANIFFYLCIELVVGLVTLICIQAG